MTTLVWNNGTFGTWSTPGNWTPSGLPGSGDDAVIDLASVAPFTVTQDYTGTIADLAMGDPDPNYADATLAFAGTAQLDVTGSVDNEGTIILSAGQALSYSSMLNDNVVLLQGGVVSGAVEDDGTIQGFGTVNGTISGGGYVEASGGILELTDPITTSDVGFEIASDATLLVDQSTLSSSVFQFEGASGELQVPTTFNGVIEGMKVGTSASVPTTRIDVGSFLTGGTIVGKTLSLYNGTSLVATERLSHTVPKGTRVLIANEGLNDTDVFFSSVAPCYAKGTSILTPDGEKKVEDLTEGDQVVVAGDPAHQSRPVKWIGQRNIDLARHPRPELAAPVRIRRNAMGPHLPRRDLLVSPDHCLFVDGKLIPAVMLVNDMTIVQELHHASIHYFHVELDRHCILLAEGLPAESYLDTGNRAYFANAGLAMLLHPEFRVNDSLLTWQDDACAPLAADAPTIQPIWQRYADEAERLGFVPRQIKTVAEPNFRVLAEGATICPSERTADRYAFVLPAGTRRITLLSRATRPADIHRYLDDRRRLGIAVASVTLRTGQSFDVFPPDHLPAAGGWHAAETADGHRWRWTNGAGVLEFDPLATAAILDIRLGGAAAYIVEEPPAQLSA